MGNKGESSTFPASTTPSHPSTHGYRGYHTIEEIQKHIIEVLEEDDPQLAPTTLEREDSGIPNEEPQVQLSELTSFGFYGPQTLKLVGEIMGTRLVLMVDISASHCFSQKGSYKNFSALFSIPHLRPSYWMMARSVDLIVECPGWQRWSSLRRIGLISLWNPVTTTEYNASMASPHWLARLVLVVSYAPLNMATNVGYYGRWLGSRSWISLESPKTYHSG
ncbi:hypothetical protein OROGR_032456 [Orobanche gracilis]